ncbi:hypothetical protein CH252_21130 [Rhodococcus sp. 06-1477-1B]|nr:hypothetical protein CH252_21130 [Rhodococcus sp. 06-1477-1B]
MATRKTRVSNADVTPPVDADVFASNPDSEFALIRLKAGLGANPIYSSYVNLRTSVYTLQTGMLDLNDLEYGVDIDEDDYRGVGFVVVQNCQPKPKAVACVRIIERIGVNDRPLPADALYGLNLDAPGVEVSRYIGRLDSVNHQRRALREMLRSTIAHVRQIGADDQVYAIVERPLERVLRIMGVGLTRVAEPVWLDEYQGVNVAIKLDPIVSAASLGGLAEIDSLDVSEGSVRFW